MKQNMEIEEFMRKFAGEPTPLRVPSSITVKVDNRIVDRFDEILNHINYDEPLLNKCVREYVENDKNIAGCGYVTLDDNTKYIFSYETSKCYTLHLYIDNESNDDRYDLPTTEMKLPAKYNQFFAHSWKMATHTGYCYAYDHGEMPKVNNPNI